MVTVVVTVVFAVEVFAVVVGVAAGGGAGKRIPIGLRQAWEKATTRETQSRDLNMMLIWAPG